MAYSEKSAKLPVIMSPYHQITMSSIHHVFVTDTDSDHKLTTYLNNKDNIRTAWLKIMNYFNTRRPH